MARCGIILVRQAGSAAGLLPAADALLAREPDCQLTVIAWPLAVPTCREVSEQLQRMTLHAVASEDQARALFDAALGRAEFVWTGTSAQAQDDAYFWRRARAHGVPCEGYLDQWVNLGLRFPGSSREDWPDALAVIDPHDAALAERIAPAGVHIRVSGSPALARIQRCVQALRADGVVADAQRIVFATEPQGDQLAYRQTNGFNDEDSFSLALALIRRWHRGATLVLRLHPRDSRERWLPLLPHDIPTRWDEDSRADCLAHAGRVMGMRSFFLLEALSAGVPVLSLQPQRRTACPLTDGRMTVLTDEAGYAG